MQAQIDHQISRGTAGRHERSVRIWSAACSSGEEAYSLAICLLENRSRLLDWRLSIVGTDISREQLTRAREGVYTQFEVQRRLVNGTWASGGTVNGATARLIVAQRLRNGSAYELRVRARNSIGWGPYSSSVTATTKLVPLMPNKPVVQPRNRGAFVAWILPGDASPAKPVRVLVQRSTNGVAWTTVYSVLPIVQQVPVIGLTNGVAYQFRLVSVNALGQSIPSPITVVTPRA